MEGTQLNSREELQDKVFLSFSGQVAKPLPLTCPDLQDPFSLTEKPPAEFCLSPDGSSEAISIDVLQKKGLYQHQPGPGVLLSLCTVPGALANPPEGVCGC